jgi:hypothetical protein
VRVAQWKDKIPVTFEALGSKTVRPVPHVIDSMTLFDRVGFLRGSGLKKFAHF